jgi:hypothetical protein
LPRQRYRPPQVCESARYLRWIGRALRTSVPAHGFTYSPHGKGQKALLRAPNGVAAGTFGALFFAAVDARTRQNTRAYRSRQDERER